MSQKIISVTGMSDVLSDEIELWQRLEGRAHQTFEHYGFGEIRTPILESTALFSRSIGEETQVVQKEMYTFEDRGGDLVTMRPEGTAGVMRAYLQHALDAQDSISKLYYMGPMFRYERPQKGRLRQFHQIGVEILGVDSPHADAEVVIMMDRLARSLGINNFRLEINSLGTLEERRPYLENLVDYLETIKAGLCEDCQGRVVKNPLRVLDCKREGCQNKVQDAPTILDALGGQSRQEFEILKKSLFDARVAFVVNPRIVRGLDYYEKTAFEFISGDLGAQSTFAAGGRYNRLALELGAKNPVPAVGFSLGCERMILLLKGLQSQNATQRTLSGVYFIGMNEACFFECQKLMQRVRDAGLKAEMEYQIKSVKSQMRRANKLGFRYAAIMGDAEAAEGMVMLKDLETGEQKKTQIEEFISQVV